MKTNIFGYVLSSENRKKVVETILEYPKRQWSCPSIEELAKINHATVFRTIKMLQQYGMLKSVKISNKVILYELVENDLAKEIRKLLQIEAVISRKIASEFVKKTRNNVQVALIYGSVIKGTSMPESDIDILLIVKSHSNDKSILDIAGQISLYNNRTISAMIMTKNELAEKSNRLFFESLKENNQVLYGKSPF